MLFLKRLFVVMVALVAEFTHVSGEGGGWLYRGVLFFIREIEDTAIDREIYLCGDSPMKWSTCARAAL